MTKKWNQLFSGKFSMENESYLICFFLSKTTRIKLNLPFKITPEMRSQYRTIWSYQASTFEHWVSEEANQIRRSLTSMICFLQQGQRNGGRREGPSFPPWYFCLLLHTRKFSGNCGCSLHDPLPPDLPPALVLKSMIFISSQCYQSKTPFAWLKCVVASIPLFFCPL